MEQHGDPFSSGRQPISVRYALATPDGGEIALTTKQDPRLAGQQVTVDDSSAAPGIQGTARASSTTRLAVRAALGPHKVAVVRVNFTNNRPNPFDDSQIRQAIWTGPGSVNQFYQRQTDGAMSLVGRDNPDGDIYGPYALPIPSTGCDYEAIASSAQSATANAGVALSGYDHVIFVFPSEGDCDFTGLGDLPGKRSWINGLLEPKIIAHELGHNMGLMHASSMSCLNDFGVRVAISDVCSVAEYGDPWDVMAESSYLMSAFHRAQIGQVAPSSQRTITASGTYTLDSVNDVLGTGTKLLLIPRRASGQLTTTSYALEIRSPLAPFDAFSTFDAAATGISIRVVAPLTERVVTKIVDMSPLTTTFADAPLASGATFTDIRYGITVRNVSSGAGEANVQVTVPTLDDTTTPSAPSDLAATVVGSTVVVTWGASSDDVALDHYEVFRNGVLLATTQANSFTDDNFAGLAAASYQVFAVDKAGNRAGTQVRTIGLPGPVGPAGPAPAPASAGTPLTATTAFVHRSSPVVMKSPKLVRGRAKLPSSGKLVFASAGASRLTIRLGRVRTSPAAKRVTAATLSYTLPRSFRVRTSRASYFSVTASGIRQVRTTLYKIQKGVITKLTTSVQNS